MHLTKRSHIRPGSSLALVGALSWGAATYASSPPPMMVPKQTPIHITLNQTLASNRRKPGQHFEATVSEPVMLDGKTVIPRGAKVEGRVVDAHPSGRLMGRARLRMALDAVQVNGQTYDIRTASYAREGSAHKKRNLLWIGGGAGGGAFISALAGGGGGGLIRRGPGGGGGGGPGPPPRGERRKRTPPKRGPFSRHGAPPPKPTRGTPPLPY